MVFLEESMQSPEDFMKGFFAARTAEIRRELEYRVPFRKKCFTDDCYWDSRSGSTERSEGEVIVEVCNTDGEVRVITQEIAPFPRLRYTLIQSNDSWLIQCVETFIEGQGWLGERDLRNRIKFFKTQLKRGTPPRGDDRFSN